MKLALLSHENKRKLMENLCIAYRHILSNHTLYATGTTGQVIEQAVNLPVHKYLSGHLGGEQQLGAHITHNDIDLVIYLRDPMHQKQYEYDINSVIRLCDVHNIPLATNLATAEALLQALDRGDLDWRDIVRQ